MRKRFTVYLLLIAIFLPLIQAYELCEETTDEIKIRSIQDLNFEDETIWEWEPIQSVQIEIEVENENLSKRDFTLELYLLDSEENQVKNFTSNKIMPTTNFYLDEEERITKTFSFTTKELNDEKYYLYAKFYDPDNEEYCVSSQAIKEGREAKIEIVEEDRLVVIRDVIGPNNITPGETAQFRVEINNIGNKAESKVSIVAYSADLGIRQTSEVLNLAIETPQIVQLDIPINESTLPSQESIQFVVEYDYQEDKDYYYRTSNKAKIYQLIILPSQNQATPQEENETAPTATNQSEPETTQTEETNLPEETSQNSEQTSENQKSFLIPIIITVILILAIITGIFFYLKYKSKKYATPEQSSSKINAYLQKIKKQKAVEPQPVPQKKEEVKTVAELTPPKQIPQPQKVTPQPTPQNNQVTPQPQQAEETKK